jgi:hypothetical protein
MKPSFHLAAATVALVLSAGAAAAADYIVVGSTDPAIARGQELVAGQKVPLKPGHRVTILGPKGDVLILQGDRGGASVPARAAAPDAEQFAVLRMMISGAPSARPAGFRVRAACPDAETLVAVEAIVGARKAGCEAQAAAALDAYLANAVKR